VLSTLACAGLSGIGGPGTANALTHERNRRVLRMIVPQPPGGAADLLARLLVDNLARALDRPVMVDNRPGGGTVIGTQAVAMAAPDGNTVGMVLSPHAINQAMRQHMPYNVLTDFEPLCLGGHSINVLVAHPGFGVDNVGQLIERARRADLPLQYASLGMGSVSHLAGEMFAIDAEVDLQHVPYNGSVQVYRALVGGEVPLAFVTLESALPHIRSGQLKALGITNARRSTRYPQIPAIAESLPGFELVGFFGFVAPARTPSEVTCSLSAEIARSLQAPAIRTKLADDGVVVSVRPPAEFAAFLRDQVGKYTALAKRTGIRLD
jgi:tripartite-type tricarboxylate transporter receptor subunit TctC